MSFIISVAHLVMRVIFSTFFFVFDIFASVFLFTLGAILQFLPWITAGVLVFLGFFFFKQILSWEIGLFVGIVVAIVILTLIDGDGSRRSK